MTAAAMGSGWFIIISITDTGTVAKICCLTLICIMCTATGITGINIVVCIADTGTVTGICIPAVIPGMVITAIAGCS
jgi:hypothetical protein